MIDDPTSLDYPIEPATWTQVDGFAVFSDGSFCRLASWHPAA